MKKIVFYINEVKNYFIYFFIFFICLCFINFYYFNDIIYIILKPLLFNIKFINTNKINNYLIYTNLTDICFVYIKLFFYFNMYLTIPFLFLQIYFFFNNCLYKYEKKNLLLFYLFFFIFYFINFFFSYLVLVPIIWNFFLNFQILSKYEVFNLYFEGRLDSYIYLLLNILTNTIVNLFTPLIIIFLYIKDIISLNILLKNKKLIYLGAVIIITIISPPDIFSQLLLILLFFLIIEISLLFIFIFENYK